MELDFFVQSSAFLWSIPFGFACGGVYEIFRLIRAVFNLKRLSLFLLDFFFMLLMFSALYVYTLAMLYGYIRLYIFVGAGVGFWIYSITLGRLLSMLYRPLIKYLKEFLRKIASKIKKILKKLLKRLSELLYNRDNKKEVKEQTAQKESDEG